MPIRIIAIIGVIGALFLFGGDMLYCGNFLSGDEYFQKYLHIMSTKPIKVLVLAGVIGFIGAILEVIGLYVIYYSIDVKNRILAAITYISFSVMILFGGLFHLLCAFYGFFSRIDNSKITNILFYELNELIDPIKIITVVTGIIGTVFFIYLVLFNKSKYPKWIILILPTLLSLLHPLTKYIAAPVGGIIASGYINITFVIFFFASTIIMWKEITPKNK